MHKMVGLDWIRLDWIDVPACLYDSSSNIKSSGFNMLSFFIMDRYIGPLVDPASTSASTSSISFFLLELCKTLALSFITCIASRRCGDGMGCKMILSSCVVFCWGLVVGCCGVVWCGETCEVAFIR